MTARILHLSDLHLAPIADDEIPGDYKSELVPLAERQRRVESLKRTLREFGEAQPGELDAVVVSGDVTIAAAESGYRMLESVLGELGPALPGDPARVLVVPGNHDVQWRTPPSSREHYELFLQYVRDACGYRTPQLEGIDISAADGRVRSSPVDPVVIGPGYGFLLLALNSSNYCGVVEPTQITDAEWETALAALGDRGEIAEKDLRKLRVMDVARISPAQLTAARRELTRARKTIEATGGDAARVPTIAILHHHLLPVSVREEFKPYESISNLGEVRAFLRDNHVDMVLHGHKHESAVYWDHIPRPDVIPDEQPLRVLVVSGATIGAGAAPGDVVRLIEIGQQPAGHRLTISSYGGVAAGGALPTPSIVEASLLPAAPRAEDGVPRIGPISGPTISDVYARTLTEFERLSDQELVANLVCEIGTSPDPGELPRDYPAIAGLDDAERSRWVADLVQWWQNPRTQLGRRLTFNHGGRIRRYQFHIDQLDRAEQALRQDADTSRAVITLLDPREDDIPHLERKFPAFCIAQFVIRGRADNSLHLDCAAYFRKQEFRWWWTINVAELASLQRELCSRLEDAYDGLEPGGIMTIAAIAKAGTAVPRVAVPLVDRLYDDDRGKLWLLAVATVVPDVPGRPVLLAEWTRIIDDLEPQAKLDVDGVPVAGDGLATLIAAIDQLGCAGPARDLRDGLQRLLEKNEVFVSRLDDPEKNSAYAHRTWVGAVQSILHDLRGVIDRLAES